MPGAPRSRRRRSCERGLPAGPGSWSWLRRAGGALPVLEDHEELLDRQLGLGRGVHALDRVAVPQELLVPDDEDVPGAELVRLAHLALEAAAPERDDADQALPAHPPGDLLRAPEGGLAQVGEEEVRLRRAG